MADPITWLAIASAAIGGIGAVQKGRQASAAAKSQANMDEYNATMAEFQARQANASAGRQEDENHAPHRPLAGAKRGRGALSTMR